MQKCVRELVAELRAGKATTASTAAITATNPQVASSPASASLAARDGRAADSSIVVQAAMNGVVVPDTAGAGTVGAVATASTTLADDAVSRALFRRRVKESVQTIASDNSAAIFSKAASTLEMMLGNIVKNPQVPRYRRLIVSNAMFK
jgi:uncharacterized protein (UPF0147 family)